MARFFEIEQKRMQIPSFDLKGNNKTGRRVKRSRRGTNQYWVPTCTKIFISAILFNPHNCYSWCMFQVLWASSLHALDTTSTRSRPCSVHSAAPEFSPDRARPFKLTSPLSAPWLARVTQAKGNQYLADQGHRNWFRADLISIRLGICLVPAGSSPSIWLDVNWEATHPWLLPVITLKQKKKKNLMMKLTPETAEKRDGKWPAPWWPPTAESANP